MLTSDWLFRNKLKMANQSSKHCLKLQLIQTIPNLALKTLMSNSTKRGFKSVDPNHLKSTKTDNTLQMTYKPSRESFKIGDKTLDSVELGELGEMGFKL